MVVGPPHDLGRSSSAYLPLPPIYMPSVCVYCLFEFGGNNVRDDVLPYLRQTCCTDTHTGEVFHSSDVGDGVGGGNAALLDTTQDVFLLSALAHLKLTVFGVRACANHPSAGSYQMHTHACWWQTNAHRARAHVCPSSLPIHTLWMRHSQLACAFFFSGERASSQRIPPGVLPSRRRGQRVSARVMYAQARLIGEDGRTHTCPHAIFYLSQCAHFSSVRGPASLAFLSAKERTRRHRRQ